MTSNVKTITAIQRALQIPEIAAMFERVKTDDELISAMMKGVNLDDETDVDAFARVNFNLSGTEFMWGLHHSEAALHVKRALDREARIRARIIPKPHRKAKGTIQLSPTAQESIRFHIAESGLKTPDYAEKCKLSARTLQRVVNDGIVTYRTLHCIARVMQVSARALLRAK